jgi:hypothetical protein
VITAVPATPADKLLVFTTANTPELLEENTGANPVDPVATMFLTGSKQLNDAITGNDTV